MINFYKRLKPKTIVEVYNKMLSDNPNLSGVKKIYDISILKEDFEKYNNFLYNIENIGISIVYNNCINYSIDFIIDIFNVFSTRKLDLYFYNILNNKDKYNIKLINFIIKNCKNPFDNFIDVKYQTVENVLYLIDKKQIIYQNIDKKILNEEIILKLIEHKKIKYNDIPKKFLTDKLIKKLIDNSYFDIILQLKWHDDYEKYIKYYKEKNLKKLNFLEDKYQYVDDWKILIKQDIKNIAKLNLKNSKDKAKQIIDYAIELYGIDVFLFLNKKHVYLYYNIFKDETYKEYFKKVINKQKQNKYFSNETFESIFYLAFRQNIDFLNEFNFSSLYISEKTLLRIYNDDLVNNNNCQIYFNLIKYYKEHYYDPYSN